MKLILVRFNAHTKINKIIFYCANMIFQVLCKEMFPVTYRKSSKAYDRNKGFSFPGVCSISGTL